MGLCLTACICLNPKYSSLLNSLLISNKQSTIEVLARIKEH